MSKQLVPMAPRRPSYSTVDIEADATRLAREAESRATHLARIAEEEVSSAMSQATAAQEAAEHFAQNTAAAEARLRDQMHAEASQVRNHLEAEAAAQSARERHAEVFMEQRVNLVEHQAQAAVEQQVQASYMHAQANLTEAQIQLQSRFEAEFTNRIQQDRQAQEIYLVQ